MVVHWHIRASWLQGALKQTYCFETEATATRVCGELRAVDDPDPTSSFSVVEVPGKRSECGKGGVVSDG